MAALATVGVVFLVPFAVHDFLKGRYPLAAAIAVVVATLAIDGFAIHRRKSPPIPYPLLLIPMAAAITISLRTQGVIGAFWCYPVVLFFHFVLSRRLANLCSISRSCCSSFIRRGSSEPPFSFTGLTSRAGPS